MGEAEAHLESPGADLESNELHAGGQTCPRCKQAIQPGDEVRRTISGVYQHDFCQPR
jgi:hypothetical protein